MRMTESDYSKLVRYLEVAIAAVGVEGIKEHRGLRLGKDVEKRFAWDLWHIACRVDKTALPWLCDHLYTYLNDDHITAALKHFTANYPAIKIEVKRMKTYAQWKEEYDELDKLYHKLEDAGLHGKAEKVADRLSEMELEEVEMG